MVDFTGQVAVVVGGATGIGAMTARHLAEAGASVVVGDVNLDGAQGVAQAIRDAGANAEARFADLAEPEVMADFVNGVASDHGGLHALHLNGADLRPEIIGRILMLSRCR
jgi:NAD(P)-dependent dehydrogenase (short-subunit alcohol dehydrogenase family)